MKQMDNQLQRDKDKLHNMMLFSQRFLDTENAPDLQEITELMRTLTGAVFAVFNQFENSGLEFSTKAIAIKNQHLKKAIDILGFNPIGKCWTRDPNQQAKVQQEMVTIFENLQSLAKKNLPVQVSRLLETTFDIGQTAVVKTMKNNKNMGEFTLIMPKGKAMESQELVVLFATQVGMYLDRVEHERHLKKSEEKYRRLFETMSPGVVYQNADGFIISANPAAERMMGITLDQMQGKTSIDPRWKMIREDGSFVPGPEHPAMAALKTGEKTGPIRRGIFIPEEDEYVWLSITAVPLFRKGENHPFQVYTLFDDISERKRAEEKLQESEHKYRTLFNHSVAGIYLHDLEGHILDVNEEGCLQVGYTREELLHMDVFDLHPNGPDRINVPKEEMMRDWQQWQPQQKFSLAAEHQHKDGTIVPIQVSTGIVFERDQKRVLAITQDITVRKKAEEALLASKEQLETLSNNIPNGMVYQLKVDPQGNRWFTYVSAGVEQVHGVTQAEALNHAQILYDQILEGDRQKLIEAEEQAFLNLDPFSSEARIRKPNGEIRWVQFLSSLSKKPDGIIVAEGIEIDITDLKKAEEKLQEYASLLEMKNQKLDEIAQEADRANQAKSRYLAHMNHEIRTPLNGFMGFLQLMDGTQPNEQQQDFMEHMKLSANHMLSIINNVLDMAKIEAGEIYLSKRVFNLEEEIQTALSPLRSLAVQNNIHLQITIDENLPCQVEGDPDRLRQIALNIGGNAIKFTRKGQVKINVKRLNSTEKHHTLQLVVEDTGPGMTQETLDKLFLPFYQADDGSTPQSKGTGLGMTITRELVELMNGEIQVDSNLGKGTRMEVTLMLGNILDNHSDELS